MAGQGREERAGVCSSRRKAGGGVEGEEETEQQQRDGKRDPRVAAVLESEQSREIGHDWGARQCREERSRRAPQSSTEDKP